MNPGSTAWRLGTTMGLSSTLFGSLRRSRPTRSWQVRLVLTASAREEHLRPTAFHGWRPLRSASPWEQFLLSIELASSITSDPAIFYFRLLPWSISTYHTGHPNAAEFTELMAVLPVPLGSPITRDQAIQELHCMDRTGLGKSTFEAFCGYVMRM